MKIYCQVTAYGLVPMYDSDYDEKQKLKVGEKVLCEVTKPRNYEFHKKFFALVRLAYQNLPERLQSMLNIHSEDDMLTCLKLDVGLASIIYQGGRHLVKVGSISFSSMDDTEFEVFYQKCVDVILTKYLKGTSRQELIDEIEQFK